MFTLAIDSVDLPTNFVADRFRFCFHRRSQPNIFSAAASHYFFSEFAGIDFTDVQSIELNVHGQNAYGRRNRQVVGRQFCARADHGSDLDARSGDVPAAAQKIVRAAE